MPKDKGNAKPGAQDQPGTGGNPSPGSGSGTGPDSGPSGADPIDGSTCPANVIADYRPVSVACSNISSPDDLPRCQEAQSAFQAKHPNIRCQFTDDSGAHVQLCISTNNPSLKCSE